MANGFAPGPAFDGRDPKTLEESASALLERILRRRLQAFCLTRREAEIVWLMASGLSNKEIAGHCGIAVQTVKDHLKHAYAKVGAHQRMALVARLIGTSA
jgi:DNA-binding CsgD family transcriptional regulator